ncbi:MAG: hypothetical protein CTY25_12005 [Methylobacterium sp.]|nr:MAG: hypothetical protein CTY25_12005 [Methylobacterium sp.]
MTSLFSSIECAGRTFRRRTERGGEDEPMGRDDDASASANPGDDMGGKKAIEQQAGETEEYREDLDPAADPVEIIDRMIAAQKAKHASRAVGEIWYESQTQKWNVQLANLAELPTAFELSERDGKSAPTCLEDFRRRDGVGELRVPSPSALVHLDGLAATNPHFRQVVDLVRVHVTASIRAQRPIAIPHMLLVGPPGIGKSHLVRAIGQALALPVTICDGPAMSGGSVFSGTDTTWKRPRGGKISEVLMRHETANSLVMIDEIDKVYQHPGETDTLDPLHSLLERSSARRWRDEYFAAEMDASHLTIIATCNSVEGIAPSLLDRFLVFRIGKPDRAQLRSVIRSIAETMASEHGAWFPSPPLDDAVVEMMTASGTPRSAAKILRLAMAVAISEGRREVTRADIDAAGAMATTTERQAMGFIR